MTAFHILLVGLGGFFGAIARYIISTKLNDKAPFGTLIVNLTGAFLLGILVGNEANLMIVLFFGTGFMGAFTTFSTLKLELMKMHINKNRKELWFYLTGTYGGGILLAFVGFMFGKMIS